MGLLYRPTDKSTGPQQAKKKSSLIGAGTAAAKGVNSVQKTLDTLDKMHEKRLENSKLLTDKKWSVKINDVDTDIFQRVDTDASLNPMKYYKRSTTPTYQRLKVSKEVLDEKGFGTIKEMLKAQEYTDSQILDIAKNSGVKIHEYDPNMMAYDPKFDPTVSKNAIVPRQPMVGRDELMELEPSGISKALDNIQDFVGDKAGDVGEWVGGHAGDFAGDIGAVGKAVGGGLKDFGGELLGATGQVGEYGQHVLGTALGKGGELVGNIAGKVGSAAGAVGGVASKVLPGVGQAMGGVKAFGGAKDIFSGENMGQGVEDLIQGGIGMASPLLLAAGPVGWTILGASFLEDMLFD